MERSFSQREPSLSYKWCCNLFRLHALGYIPGHWRFCVFIMHTYVAKQADIPLKREQTCTWLGWGLAVSQVEGSTVAMHDLWYGRFLHK
jgi:hypothetical protein